MGIRISQFAGDFFTEITFLEQILKGSKKLGGKFIFQFFLPKNLAEKILE